MSVRLFLEQRLPSVLLGGYKYDAYSPISIFLAHTCIFSFLIFFPLGLSLTGVSMAAYVAPFTILFGIAIFSNYLLHRFFDDVTADQEEPQLSNEEENEALGNTSRSIGESEPENTNEHNQLPQQSPSDGTSGSQGSAIEMVPLPSGPQEDTAPPHQQQDPADNLVVVDDGGIGIRVEGGTQYLFIDENGEEFSYFMPDEAEDVVANGPGPVEMQLGWDDLVSIDPAYAPRMHSSGDTDPPKPKYSISILSAKMVVPFDRRDLEHLFDHSGSFKNTWLHFMAGFFTAFLAWEIQDRYQGAGLFFFWVTVATSQFALLKSPQPDSSSTDVLSSLLLIHPLLFLLGIFSQVKTFLFYICEHVHINIFGGSGAVNLRGALVTLLQDIVVFSIACGIGVRAFHDLDTAGAPFAFYVGFITSMAFLLSALPSDYSYIYEIKLQRRQSHPLAQHVLWHCGVSLCILLLASILIMTTLFDNTHPYLMNILLGAVFIVGVLRFYMLPQARKVHPFKLFSRSPFNRNMQYQDGIRLDNSEFVQQQEQPHNASRLPKLHSTCVGELAIWSNSLLKHVLIPLIFIAGITHDAPLLLHKWGRGGALVTLTLVSMGNLSSAFRNPSRHHWMLPFAKVEELMLKFHFFATYTLPGPDSWGSGVHVVLHFLALPHSAFTFVQMVISTILSSPIIPFMGSNWFFVSYPRPLKFFERKYESKRMDTATVKLGDSLGVTSSLSLTQGYDKRNLNSIFYEHIKETLYRYILSSVGEGQWGNIHGGDFFWLVSDSLTAFIHIIELGHGFLSFQVRGVEFTGTYCQEQELTALRSSISQGDTMRMFKSDVRVLSLKKALRWRWQTWDVVCDSLFLPTYNIIQTPAAPLLQMYGLRLTLLRYFVMLTIHNVCKSPNLLKWLENDTICAGGKSEAHLDRVDLDPVFSANCDMDYDGEVGGVSLRRFSDNYKEWIKYCLQQRADPALPVHFDAEDKVVHICFGLSVVGRRALMRSQTGDISPEGHFIERFHTIFKGDIRMTTEKDEWIYEADHDFLSILCNSLRLSLQLHLDHFIEQREEENLEELADTIMHHEKGLVVCAESDPLWKEHISKNAPRLLTLRRQQDDRSGASEYSILHLELRFVKFKLISVNKESVRGMWAGQIHEQVFLGNQNRERGSIQQFTPCLRNMINSNLDLPVGYPIYVSPVVTTCIYNEK